jgi:hypothetical protein
MGCTRLLRAVCGGMLAVGMSVVRAQSLAPAPAVAATPAAAPVVPALPKARPGPAIRFSVEKPVMGLPIGSSKSRAHCATDGVTFFDFSKDAATQVLYSISPQGEVKQVLRKLPVGFSDVSVQDFFAGEGVLATLLEADQRADGTDATAPPKERDYFLSLSDEMGDLSSLVQLQLRFKPVKVARFGSGDALVLGWDEGNLLPVLALLRDDGTIRRFIDFDERRETHGDEAPKERVTLDALRGASFVAYGREVMLTYPGTTKGIRVLSAIADSRAIPLSVPPGYVLRDVLASSGRATLVARMRPAEDLDKSAREDASPDAKVRMFEFDSTHGALLRELKFEKPAVVDVTCAANFSLTALFYDTVAEKDKLPANAGDKAADPPTQLVVSTTRR